MIENRSVPPNTILPHVVYQDIAQAIAWLSKTFGFREHYRYGDPASGAQLYLGNAWIMLKQAAAGRGTPAQLGSHTQSLTVFVEDLENHFHRAKAAGAKIVEDLHETPYGELQYAAEDFAGHHWLFSRHAHDVSPTDWGATIAQPAYRLALLPRPRFCYFEIPALDVHQSAAFYAKVFGWNIRKQDAAHPSFDDATGNISGTWVTDRAVSRDAGLLPSIWVDNIDVSLAMVAAHGGAILEPVQPVSPEGSAWIATFRDPAGNVLRFYTEVPR
ncbi:MAG TPA: VOC family protein [Candidatus Acidoferrales bacterium]|nr:VOC family protein [Candidatus Acidoferrales bacterium]